MYLILKLIEYYYIIYYYSIKFNKSCFTDSKICKRKKNITFYCKCDIVIMYGNKQN